MVLTASEAEKWPEFPDLALKLLRDARCLVDRVMREEVDPEWKTHAGGWDRAVGNILDEPEYKCPWCAEREGEK